ERATLFARARLLAGLSADIPEAGDYLTLSGAGAPVVIVRGHDGVARAMVNTCRHRGARLVEGRGQARRCIVCPYHSWTYDLAGRLTPQPGAGARCSGLDRRDHGLRPVPEAEGRGLPLVGPSAGPAGATEREPGDPHAAL